MPRGGGDHGTLTAVGVRFGILGPVRIWVDGAEVDIGPPTRVSLLSLLLVRAGQPVTMAEIVDALWGDDPPRTAVNIVHRSVGALRRLTDPSLPARAAGRLLLPSSSGYRLVVTADTLDLVRFRQLRAAGAFTQALALWRGPVAERVAANVRGRPEFEAVTHEYLAVLGEAVDAGSATEVLPLLRQAAQEHPLNESVQAKLIEALVATGKHREARSVYETVRDGLADSLGVDPGPELRRALGQPRIVPSQLPADLPEFSGREGEIANVMALLNARTPGTTCVAISGMAGVGKTTLAVHFAHRIAGRFPDGLLYIHMRGYGTGDVLSSDEAIGILLEAIGVPSQRVPDGLDARTALYRSMLAGKRVLVVVDDARDSEHARPLLPGTADAMVIVTSRDRLVGLVARNGAHPVVLGLPTSQEALDLLARLIGASRVAEEPDAATEIVLHCGRLPLALGVVAARVTAWPNLRLADIAAQLRADRLTALDSDEADVRTVFSWSYHAVSPDAARMYRLLSVHPGGYITGAAAASLAGLPLSRAHSVLAELSRANLINERLPGRYVFHELVRAHAAELVSEEETGEAQDRLVGHYLYSARAASTLLYAYWYRSHPGPQSPGEGVTVMGFADNQQAEAWLRSELAVLLAVAGQTRGRLAAAIEIFLDRQGRWQDQVTLQRDALATADDARVRAGAHRALGFALGRLDDFGAADVHLAEAFVQFDSLKDLDGVAITNRYQAFLANRRSRYDQALEFYEHALECYETTSDGRGQATVHNEVGWTHILAGDYTKALSECELAVSMQEELGNANGEASAADSVGYAYHHLGQDLEAIRWYERALRIYRRIKDVSLEADTLRHIGQAYQALGNEHEANSVLRQALEILEDLGHPDAEQVRAQLS
ncbi:DNA-binding transcriptional activator of the SARP family [Kibdelosporangium aridum]|uniref:DNA-binding transcriptional activator of the SARP family n=1 Tax=Kibdelosporangium aridum TaxID=2030 RepID=A0A1W2B484_KIBAR|nr:DNA-binding transcriptional activator of the SARP family [Kibdelosporangium aridum]